MKAKTMKSNETSNIIGFVISKAFEGVPAGAPIDWELKSINHLPSEIIDYELTKAIISIAMFAHVANERGLDCYKTQFDVLETLYSVPKSECQS